MDKHHEGKTQSQETFVEGLTQRFVFGAHGMESQLGLVVRG